MSEEKLTLEVQLVAKESPDARKVIYKANASISEDEALEKYTIGSLEDDEKPKE